MPSFYNSRSQKMRRISPKILGYIAGILDGEGCISIKRHPYRTKKGRMFFNYSLVVDVAQREKRLTEYLKRVTGLGSMQFNKGQKMYNWHLTASQARPLLQAAMHILIVKRSQAVLAIRFHNLAVKKRSTGKKALTRKELAKRKRFSDEMKRLKTS